MVPDPSGRIGRGLRCATGSTPSGHGSSPDSASSSPRWPFSSCSRRAQRRHKGTCSTSPWRSTRPNRMSPNCSRAWRPCAPIPCSLPGSPSRSTSMSTLTIPWTSIRPVLPPSSPNSGNRLRIRRDFTSACTATTLPWTPCSTTCRASSRRAHGKPTSMPTSTPWSGSMRSSTTPSTPERT